MLDLRPTVVVQKGSTGEALKFELKHVETTHTFMAYLVIYEYINMTLNGFIVSETLSGQKVSTAMPKQ